MRIDHKAPPKDNEKASNGGRYKNPPPRMKDFDEHEFHSDHDPAFERGEKSLLLAVLLICAILLLGLEVFK